MRGGVGAGGGELLLRWAVLLGANVLSVFVIVRYLLFVEPAPQVFDYIVVGGGSTGSVVAGRLGQAGYSVLMLEAGGATQWSLGGTAEPVAGKWTIFDVPLGWVQASEPSAIVAPSRALGPCPPRVSPDRLGPPRRRRRQPRGIAPFFSGLRSSQNYAAYATKYCGASSSGIVL